MTKGAFARDTEAGVADNAANPSLRMSRTERPFGRNSCIVQRGMIRCVRVIRLSHYKNMSTASSFP